LGLLIAELLIVVSKFFAGEYETKIARNYASTENKSCDRASFNTATG